MQDIKDFVKENKFENHIRTDIFSKIMKRCLSIKDEKVHIMGDIDSPVSGILMANYLLAAEKLGLSFNATIQGKKYKGQHADEQVDDELDTINDGNILCLVSSITLGSLKRFKSFRRFALDRGHRFLSTSNLQDLPIDKIDVLFNSLDIDYDLMKTRSDKLREALDKARMVNVRTLKGTDIDINVEGISSKPNDGNYSSPGSGGNLPFGEVYMPPNGKDVNGSVVVDGSVATRKGTVLLSKDAEFVFKDGELIDIKNPEIKDIIEESLDWAHKNSKYPWGIRRFCELGIGTNPRAEICGPTILNEKMYKTAHFAIGSNKWFGGTITAKIHLDHVFKDPLIRVDGKLLKY